MFEFSLYLLTGLVTGVLAGLLGIGGGVIIVPTLLYIFTYVQMPQWAIMHMAESTALAAIILTTLMAVVIQQRHHNIRWDIFRRLSLGIVVGTTLGAAIASLLPNNILKILFGVFISLISIHMLFSRKHETIKSDQYSPPWIEITSGFLVGGVSGMLGIGGGVFIVPILLRFGLSAHSAAATSSACALLLSLVGTLSYMIAGWQVTGLPHESTGFVYWPAVLGIALTSVIFVPLGTKLANRLSGKTLIRIFALFLLLVGLRMLIS